MKERMLPQSLVNITVALYRFMAKGFGKDVPKPYRGNFCGVFWAVFFTYVVPILAPFVLLAVAVRLIFGKRRGEKLGNKVISFPPNMVATKTRATATGIVIIGLLAIPAVLFWAIAWKILAGIGVVFIALALYIGLLIAMRAASDRWKLQDFLYNLADNIEEFWDRLPKAMR